MYLLHTVIAWNTTHHTLLHITPQKIGERCQIWWPCWPENWSPCINPSIWIRKVEVIPHISSRVRMWLKDCITAVLGHQQEWEQIVTPVRSQTLTFYSTQAVRFRTGFLLEQGSSTRLRPSGEFCAAREGYFTKYNALWILKLESVDTIWLKENNFTARSKILNNYPKL